MTSNVVGRPIVVGVDGSTSAQHAALWAAREAVQRNLPLRLVYAATVSAFTYTGGALGPPQEFFDALVAGGWQRVAEATAAIREVHPALAVDTDVRVADSVTTLLTESDTAALLVLGSRGLGGFTGMLAGSTAVGVVAHGHCPVVVVRGHMPEDAPPVTGPVVVGVDGSPASEAAVAMAFEEASLRGADLVAVHTWIEFASDTAYAHARQFFVDWDDIATRERERLAERLAGWQEKYPDVTVRRVVTRDRPVRCLIEHAAEAQLLVVGSRGHGGFTGMLLGSTSQALIYHAPCPLLVVRPTDER